MEIDGAINLDKVRPRRVVPVVAMILPMVVVIGGAAWFVRAYVAPPMVSIPAPSMLASWEPTQPPAQGNATAAPEPVAPEPVAPPPVASQPPSPPSSPPSTWAVPMMASLAFVPPSFPASDRVDPPPAPAKPQAASPKLPELAISVPEQMPERELDSRPERPERPEVTAVLGPGAIFIVPLPRPRPNY
jgi:DNA polymerase-3 subunit gamma/tau